MDVSPTYTDKYPDIGGSGLFDLLWKGKWC